MIHCSLLLYETCLHWLPIQDEDPDEWRDASSNETAGRPVVRWRCWVITESRWLCVAIELYWAHEPRGDCDGLLCLTWQVVFSIWELKTFWEALMNQRGTNLAQQSRGSPETDCWSSCLFMLMWWLWIRLLKLMLIEPSLVPKCE